MEATNDRDCEDIASTSNTIDMRQTDDTNSTDDDIVFINVLICTRKFLKA